MAAAQALQSKPSYVFKVVLVGEVGVGKTSTFVRLKDNRFFDAKSTIGIDKYEFTQEVNGVVVKIDLWDTAGSEKYRTLTGNYYHSAKACVYVYDITESSSLYGLSAWIADAQRFARDHLKFLVGNKTDLDDDRDVTKSTADTFAREKGFSHCAEISAKMGDNVVELFRCLAEKLVANFAPEVSSSGGAARHSGGGATLRGDEAPVSAPQKKCC
ncbi:uncharacterized protein [Oscarella lobularis]|uniref:uncharacterized protein n=1 Tax=Oscarella lobularis TaxID=121494 RepID=UPI003313CFE2